MKMMTEFPDEKYKVYTDNRRQVIAISTYAGRNVKGVATCDERDTFNYEIGKEIAIAKCNQKIAEKRLKRANKKVAIAEKEMVDAYNFSERMKEYRIDANAALEKANKRLYYATLKGND